MSRAKTRQALRRWFSPHIWAELEALDSAIDGERDHDCRRLGQVALSDLLRRASKAHGRYPNVMFDAKKEPPSSFGPAFSKRVGDLLDSVAELTPRMGDYLRPDVVWGDARRVPLSDSIADAIVTHPPYIGSVPYAEYGYLSLAWFGHDPRWVDEVLTGGRRQKKDVVQRFREGYGQMLTESARILKPGGRAFIMVGNPTVRGKTVDLAAMTIELATAAGLSLSVRHAREGTNRRANHLAQEALLFFEKARR